jgi:ABC-2 type transport system ATP-binding protein
MTDSIIEVKNLVKHYGKIAAVNDVSFSVREGICFGLLGPNGAGKTTAIEIMESIRKPDGGEVRYRGGKIDHRFKERIGIQFQSTALQEFLTVRETLVLFSRLYPKHKPLDEIVRICSLEEFENRDNRKLSGGQRQRMLLGIALVNDPDLLFLDEPTTGLDPQARRSFWQLVENIKREHKTIILTTHYMDEAEYLCEETVIMDKGKIIEQGSPPDLLRKHFGGATIRIPVSAAQSELSLPCEYERQGETIEIRCTDTEQTIRELIKNGVSLSGMTVEKQNLDDLFIKLTGASLVADEGGNRS